MERIIQGLMNLGLNRKEAQVYAALAQLGSASAQKVATAAGLKRPTTYLVLGDLMKKGLVLKVPKLRKQMFAAKNPRELLAMAEERLQQAKNVLPALEALRQDTKRVHTLYFEGIDGMRDALYYRFADLKNTEIYAFFGSAEYATEDMHKLFHQWNNDVHKSGTKLVSIVPDSPTLKEYRKREKAHGFISQKIHPRLYTSKVSVDITPLFVRVLMFKEEEAVIIESTDVAKAMKEIFFMVYGQTQA